MYSFLRSNLTTRHIRNGGWLLKLPFSKKKKQENMKKALIKKEILHQKKSLKLALTKVVKSLSALTFPLQFF